HHVQLGPLLRHAEHPGHRAARRGYLQHRTVPAPSRPDGVHRGVLHPHRRADDGRGVRLVRAGPGRNQPGITPPQWLGPAQPASRRSVRSARRGQLPDPVGQGRVAVFDGRAGRQLRAPAVPAGLSGVSAWRHGRSLAVLRAAPGDGRYGIPAEPHLAQITRLPQLQRRRPARAAPGPGRAGGDRAPARRRRAQHHRRPVRPGVQRPRPVHRAGPGQGRYRRGSGHGADGSLAQERQGPVHRQRGQPVRVRRPGQCPDILRHQGRDRTGHGRRQLAANRALPAQTTVTVVAGGTVVRVTNESWRVRNNCPDRRAMPMKLPEVEYEAPTTVAEAVDLLAEHGDEASVLAGGQSLIPLLALRLARPEVLIDINRVDELSGVSAADGHVTIGAMTREYVAEESGTVADTLPLLAAALPLIGHEAIRSRGTIGGSLAHADPAAELPAVARALDAEFVVRGPSGTRVIPAAQWFDGYLTTSRRPDELLAEVRFPAARPGTGVSFEEVARRHGDFAIVGLAASLVLSGGVISDARLAFAGVSDVPVRATAAEDLLAGERPSAELFDEAARRATEDLDPPADLHGSSDSRKTVAAAVVRRGLRAAADNAARGSN